MAGEVILFIRKQSIMTELDFLYETFLRSAGVTTDTRKCGAGMMFFALRGASFNGNEFAAQALEAGCVCAVVDDARYADDARCVLVDDALAALQSLAALHRRRMGEKGLRVLQITGTNGKTTTKELCAAVLSTCHRVLYTEGNLNNHIGVPLTLLRLREEHDVAVIETGANHPGEIAALTQIVQPDYGLVTNVGRAHLEGFGSFDGVKRTKGELYDWLAAHDRPAFINPDNEDLAEMASQRPSMSVMPYLSGEAVKGDNVTMRVRIETEEFATQLVGDYNADNVRAAATVGRAFGVSLRQAAEAIAAYTPSNNRSQLVRTARNTLIVDAYNANPSSMKVAIANFAAIDAPKKMIILGEMRELGDQSDREHRIILTQAFLTRYDALWLVGDAYDRVAQTTYSQRIFPNVEAVKAVLREKPVSGYTILIKGSNATKLYELPELL